MNRWPFIWLVIAVGLLGGARTAAAQEDFERFDIRGGGGWVFGANTNMALTGSRGVGTAIDFDKTLGASQSDTLARVEGTWRYTNHSSLNFTWYKVQRTGNKQLDQDIQFGNQTFPTSILVDSEIDMALYRLLYRYRLADYEDIKFDVGGGFYVMNVKARLTAASTVGAERSGTNQEGAVTGPVPSAGMLVRYNFNKRLSALLQGDLFYTKINKWSAALTDAQVGLEYLIVRHVSLGLAYDRFGWNIEGPVKSGDFQVNNIWNTLYTYLSIHW